MTTKTCSKCREDKPITEFHRRADGLQNICKSCRKSASTPSPRKHITNDAPAVGLRIVALEARIRLTVASPVDPSDADDAFQFAVEYLLTHMQANDADGRYLANAKMRAKEYRNQARTYTFYVATEDTLTSDGLHDGFEMLAADTESAEDETIRRQEAEAIMQAVAELNPENQKVVSMLYAGYKQSEIARALNVSEAAISLRIDRIASQLHTCGLTA